uniref:Myozenin 2a n=1 Tax=Oryzias melastigma TaxID=30732 RepID=A0A3B3BHJ1_ORYME
MSRIATMTTRERKMQAAAICREVHAQDDFPMDLGKKMSVPKDIMLEELSLASNRGSRLFKLRQRRSEKYTFETVHNQNNMHILTLPGTPTLFNCHLCCVTHPGYGGPLKDIPPEKFNSTAVPKSYHSPWEQAIINDPALADTLITRMPHMEPQAECPGYRSFNRVATPFGGFSKAPRPAPDSPLQVDTLPEADGAPHRPSFNRSALGWASTAGPAALPTVCPELVLIPESEDL